MKGKKIVVPLLAAAFTTLLASFIKNVWGYTASADEAVATTTVLSVLLSVITPDRMEADE